MDGLGAGKVDTGIDDEGVVGLVESASDGACEVRGVSLSEAVSVAGVCDGVEATSAPSRRRCLSSGSWSASDDGLGASRLRRRLLARGGKGSCGTEYQGSGGLNLGRARTGGVSTDGDTGEGVAAGVATLDDLSEPAGDESVGGCAVEGTTGGGGAAGGGGGSGW